MDLHPCKSKYSSNCFLHLHIYFLHLLKLPEMLAISECKILHSKKANLGECNFTD